jgi:hypothetical protein
MKRLTMTIATVMAMIALLPEYSDAMASNYHRRHGGGGGGDSSGYSVGTNAGPGAPAPVSVPEPGSFLLLASGLSTVGGLLAGKWYVTRQRAKRQKRSEP